MYCTCYIYIQYLLSIKTHNKYKKFDLTNHPHKLTHTFGYFIFCFCLSKANHHLIHRPRPTHDQKSPHFIIIIIFICLIFNFPCTINFLFPTTTTKKQKFSRYNIGTSQYDGNSFHSFGRFIPCRRRNSNDFDNGQFCWSTSRTRLQWPQVFVKWHFH